MCEDVAKAREYVERLRRKRKTVKLDELASCLATSDWTKIHAAIEPLLADGTLTPPRTAKSNGSVEHPLFEKYRIKDEPVPAHDLTILHPMLVTSSYLERHPVECRGDDRRHARLTRRRQRARQTVPSATINLPD